MDFITSCTCCSKRECRPMVRKHVRDTICGSYIAVGRTPAATNVWAGIFDKLYTKACVSQAASFMIAMKEQVLPALSGQ